MTVVQFVRLIKNHLLLLLVTPLLFCAATWVLFDDSSLQYSTNCKVYTGFASGYSIKNGFQARYDFYAIKNKFDNFFESTRSRSTIEEISLKTVAYYLCLDEIPEREMTLENQAIFKEVFDQELTKKLCVKGNLEKTYQKLLAFYSADVQNIIYLVINSRNSGLRHLFGIGKLKEIGVSQEGTSDLVLFTYEANDPGVTFRTMNIALDVFLSKVKLIKTAESGSVVEYFRAEVAKAQKRLDDEERKLAVLMTQNNITNYYEQTKFIASRKEDFQVAFQQEKLGLAAALAAEREAEVTMGISSGIKVKTNSIMKLRNSIRAIQAKKVKDEISEDFFYEKQEITDSLDMKQKNGRQNDSLSLVLSEKEEELKTHIHELLEMKNTASGIQMEDVALKWLEAVIKVEEYKARIIQFIQFEKEFEITYARFSRLGSKIKQLERKISVYERDYLSFVSSLNDAKLIEENIQMSSSLKVIDQPYYPLDAKKSKKAVIIIVVGFVGLLLCVGILVALEYLDASIRTPKRLRQKSQLDLVGGFPLFDANSLTEDKRLHEKLIRQIATFVNSSYYEHDQRPNPFVVVVWSTREQEGKTKLSHLVANELRNCGEPTLVVQTADGQTDDSKGDEQDNIVCQRPQNVYDEDLSSILTNHSQAYSLENYRYVLYEVPAIIGEDLPIKIIRNAHLSLLVAKASRIWNKADTMAVATYQSMVNHHIGAILNGAMVDELEEIIGEIPKRRSRFRKKMKQFAKFQFRSKKF